jgi:hypothetical protein
MYLLVTHWPDQNPIIFPCGPNRRSNCVAPLSLPRHTINLSLLLLLNTLLLLLLNTLLLLFLVSMRTHLNMTSRLLLLEELP